MNRFIFRVFDLLAALTEAPFKIWQLLFLPLVGLITIVFSVVAIALGVALWGPLAALLVGFSFIASPWAFKKRR